MMTSVKELFDAQLSLAPAARTATANGSGVDLQNFGAAVAVITFGAYTDGTHAIKLQESDDNSAFTDVAAAQVDGSNPSVSGAGGASQTYRLGYLGTKRYLRVVATVSGTTTGAVYGANIERHLPKKAPK